MRRQTGLEKNFMNHMDEAGIMDLNRRDINGDDERARPARGLATRRSQHPFADLKDGSALLGDGDEHAWRHFSGWAVPPSRQRLEADHFAGVDPRLGLIDQ